MKKIKNLFGNYELTWKRLIIFSVICGVYTAAVLLIPGVRDTALREIGVGYECWFLLAIFVVSNCKSGKEAALKCFVFFLISQPLVYLCQQPFSDHNLLKEYYKPWFIKTLLTLPGGYIAWQIKRKDWLGALVLSVAGTAVALMGVVFFMQGLKPIQVSYLLYGVFLVVSVILLGFLFCEKKAYRIGYLILSLSLGLILGPILSQNKLTEKHFEQALSEENWEVSAGAFDKMKVDVEDDVLKIIWYKESAQGRVTLQNEQGEERHITVRIEDGIPVIEEE